MTHDGVLPTPLEFRENDGSRGFARLGGSLQELTDLLGPPQNRIAPAPARQDKPREGNPDWATGHMNRCVAYRERQGGDRSEYQEQAIGAFEDSLLVWTRERDPREWAAARMNLGIAYWGRLVGETSENHERAIAAFEDALL